MSEFPLPQTQLPALDALLNRGLWQRWAAEKRVFPIADLARAVGYVRLKPRHSCRVTVFDGRTGRGAEPPLGFLLHLLPSVERARELYGKVGARLAAGVAGKFPPFVCDSPPAVAIPFPHDPVLDGLERVFEPDRFRRTLAEVLPEFPEAEWRIQKRLSKTTLLHYKPERRAVFRIQARLRRRTGDEKARILLHAKVARPAEAERAHVNHHVIAAALPPGADWGVAHPRGLAADSCFYACDWVDGEDLAALLGRGGADALAALAAGGRAVAALHSLDLPLPHRPSPMEEGEELCLLAEDLALILPDHRERILGLGEALACAVSRLALVPSVIVHGDLHPGQVLLSNGAATLVDFDAAGRGYAAWDLGSFLARLAEREAPPAAREAFLAGYRDAGGAASDPALLAITTAAALFRRAFFPLRELRRDWPVRAERLISRSDEILKEALP